MLCSLRSVKARFRHLKLHNIYILGMAYCLRCLWFFYFCLCFSGWELHSMGLLEHGCETKDKVILGFSSSPSLSTLYSFEIFCGRGHNEPCSNRLRVEISHTTNQTCQLDKTEMLIKLSFLFCVNLQNSYA